MKKSVLIVLAVLSLLAAVTNTVAYFTDGVKTDTEMASGELSILQHEYEYAADGTTLQPYTQRQALYPGVFADKIVTVENAGRNNAYVRTFIAVPTAGQGRRLAEVQRGTDGGWRWADTPVQDVLIDGRTYDIYAATYQKPLEPGEETPPCMTGFAVSARVGQMDGRYFYLDGEERLPLDGARDFFILVATQAAQAAVFEDAAAAMRAAYGNRHHPWENIIRIASQAELDAALLRAPYDTCIDLKAGAYQLPEQLPAGVRIAAGSGEVKVLNTVLRGYDVEIDGVIFPRALSFSGHGSFQETVFQKGCSAVPDTGDILFAQCIGAPGASEIGGHSIVVLP